MSNLTPARIVFEMTVSILETICGSRKASRI